MDQTQTTRYVSRFESLLYVPAFTQKDFHYVHTGPFTTGPSPRNYYSTLVVHYSSLNHNHNYIYTRGIDTKPKLNHLYTRGIGTKPKQRKDYNLGVSMITNNN